MARDLRSTGSHLPGEADKSSSSLRDIDPSRTEPYTSDDALRSIASWLGVGGYNALTVDAADFEDRIRCGVDMVIAPWVEDARRYRAHGSADLVSYLHRQWAWSKETFGPDLRTKGIVQHITKELREIEAEPHDLAEWVDVIILAMDGFWRHGGKPEDLLPAMQAKQDKNFARKWPDWRAMGEDQAIEHDRSGEPAQAIEVRRTETQSGSARESAVGESRGAHE